MPEIVVTVHVGGKIAYTHGMADAPDTNAAAVNALQVALNHFRDVKAAATPLSANSSGAGMQLPQTDQRGPTL
jgi:hypothetical protein